MTEETTTKRGPGRPRKYPKVDEVPVLVVTMGRSRRIEIGPRVTDPGYPTYLSLVYWDIKRAGEGAGPDTPMCGIKLTKEWYEEYIKDKTVYDRFSTYANLLRWFDSQGDYEFACDICGDVLDSLKAYHKHLVAHIKAAIKLQP